MAENVKPKTPTKQDLALELLGMDMAIAEDIANAAMPVILSADLPRHLSFWAAVKVMGVVIGNACMLDEDALKAMLEIHNREVERIARVTMTVRSNLEQAARK